MVRFILRKLGYGLVVLLGVVIAVFVLFLYLPWDPGRLTMGQRTDLTTLENVNRELGLDKPKHIQFLLYLNDLSPLSVLKNDSSVLKKYHYTKLVTLSSSSFLA